MNTTQILKSVALLVGGSAALLLSGCGSETVQEAAPVARPVKTMTVAGSAGAERIFPGRVEAANQVDLSFRVGGQLIEFPVNEGDMLSKGRLVARLDPRDFEIRLDAARAEFERTDADLRRISALYEKDAVSKAQLDQSQAARDVAGASQANAETNLGYSRLNAPFAGRVGKRFVENFQDVRQKEPVISLVDISNIEIVVDVPETVVAQAKSTTASEIRARLTARFEIAPGRDFNLTVKEAAAQADPTTQTFRLTLSMPQPDGINVLPGMTANVVMAPPADGSDSGAFVVPAAAVFANDQGDSQLWVVDETSMTVSPRKVTTGTLTGTGDIEILDGIEAGETIAVSAVTTLREGMKIRPLSELEGYER